MGKILAVGDIHTKTWIIQEVERIMDEYDHVVFCGDYVDNWNTPHTHSMGTWRLLKAFMEENPKVKAVIGNHDYSYLHPAIAGVSSGWNPSTYTLINAPENRNLKEWLLSLPPLIELDGVTFSHAGITEQWDGDTTVYGLWNDTSPIWARPKEYGGYTTYKKIPQVIGHNPSEKIWNPEENIWCIDTFSEKRDNTPIGDQTFLEIVDGKEFKPVKTNISENYGNPSYFEADVS